MQPLISLTSCIGQELSKKEVPWTSPELGNLSHILHTSLPEECAAHILSSPVNMFKAPHLRSLLVFLKKKANSLHCTPDMTIVNASLSVIWVVDDQNVSKFYRKLIQYMSTHYDSVSCTESSIQILSFGELIHY